MLSEFHIQNFKALRDVALRLTPIHVFIGPNDSGKTSILQAIGALSRSVDVELSKAFVGRWQDAQLVWQGKADLQVTLGAEIQLDDHQLAYSLSCGFQGRNAFRLEERIDIDGKRQEFTGRAPSTQVQSDVVQGVTGQTTPSRQAAELVHSSLTGCHTYRWDPSMLALPVAPDSSRRFRMEYTGFGLAMCLDDIIGHDRARFGELEQRFRQVFPHVNSIRLEQQPAFRWHTNDATQVPRLGDADGKGVFLTFADGGAPVPASQLSDGTLLVLAYLAILYLPKPPRFLLVEEPENGIHPELLRKVVATLRDLVDQSKQTQVLLTTHSPYVVDLFKPEEVTLCRKEQDGSVSVRRLSESETVREQVDIFTLGEIWTAEGDEALVNDGEPTKAAKP
jgi:predicted ATPase